MTLFDKHSVSGGRGLIRKPRYVEDRVPLWTRKFLVIKSSLAFAYILSLTKYIMKKVRIKRSLFFTLPI